jgi:hypothetical protein
MDIFAHELILRQGGTILGLPYHPKSRK